MLKGCFGEGPFSFDGRALHDPRARRLPEAGPAAASAVLHRWRRAATLALAGREADIVGLAPRVLAGAASDPPSLTLAATAEKIDWVREAAGDRFDDLVFNVYPSAWPITITDDARGEAARVDRAPARPATRST